MEALGRYILSVTAAAIAFAVLQTLVGKKGTASALVRLIGGLFLTFTVIAPIAALDLDAIFASNLDFMEQGSAIAAQGQEIAQSELRTIIKQRCEAYILDKAETYRAQLEVEVTLSQDDIPTPTAVRLRGSASPYAKFNLQQWLQDEMGIPREHQVWIG